MFQFSVTGLWNLIRAAHEGEILLNPTAWKNVELVKGVLVIILLAVLKFFPDVAITDAQVAEVSFAIATLGSIVLTLLTTKKVGLPARGRLYEKAIEKTAAINDDGFAGDGDGLQFQYEDSETDPPMQSKASDNSVNSGGDGLLGGKRH